MVNRYQMLGIMDDKLTLVTADFKTEEEARKNVKRYNFTPHTCVMVEELPDVFEGNTKWRYL